MFTLTRSPTQHHVGLLRRALGQDDSLPLTQVLSDELIQDAFEQHHVPFGLADEDVYTPAVTLWAVISQMLHAGPARSVKAAAGRVVTLIALTQNQVVACNPATGQPDRRSSRPGGS